jgi:hypothetical protein
MINRLEDIGLGRTVKAGAICARPVGLVYAVSGKDLEASRLVPSESRPTKVKPAPVRDWRRMTLADCGSIVAHSFVSPPNAESSARSYTKTIPLDREEMCSIIEEAAASKVPPVLNLVSKFAARLPFRMRFKLFGIEIS